MHVILFKLVTGNFVRLSKSILLAPIRTIGDRNSRTLLVTARNCSKLLETARAMLVELRERRTSTDTRWLSPMAEFWRINRKIQRKRSARRVRAITQSRNLPNLAISQTSHSRILAFSQCWQISYVGISFVPVRHEIARPAPSRELRSESRAFCSYRYERGRRVRAIWSNPVVRQAWE